MFSVTFIVNSSGQRVTRAFDSPFECRKFVNKLRHSKVCTLVSYPNFS